MPDSDFDIFDAAFGKPPAKPVQQPAQSRREIAEQRARDEAAARQEQLDIPTRAVPVAPQAPAGEWAPQDTVWLPRQQAAQAAQPAASAQPPAPPTAAYPQPTAVYPQAAAAQPRASVPAAPRVQVQEPPMTYGFADEASAQPKKRKGKRIALGVIAALLIAILGVGGYFGARLLASMDEAPTMDDTEVFPDEALRPQEWTPPASDESGVTSPPVNILLIGSDSRGEDGANMGNLGDRSDVIMVAHVAPDGKTVHIMSIMRDSWVEIPGYGYDKINAALAVGGVPLLTSTVEQIIDQRIDHVAIIDFEGFKSLTDSLGGVTVNNEIEFTGSHTGGPYYYPQGEITLSGDEALVYVRERYVFPDGDYQRVRNQRAYLKGVMNQVLSAETLTNPIKLAETLESFAPYVNRSSGLNPTTLAKLGLQMGGVPKIEMFTMPTSGTGWEGEQSVVYLNDEGVAAVREAFKRTSLLDWTAPAAY